MPKKDRKKELELKLETMEKECEELKKQLEDCHNEKLRLLAEIQNLHKRYARELEEARKSERRKLILEIAELLDLSFSAIRSLSTNPNESIASGFRMIGEELEKRLRKLGIEFSYPEGEKFDYRIHHAVSVKESDVEEGTILEVIRSAIIFEGEVLRPALVVVAKKNNNKNSEEVDS
jgi:molecular chaperone GrpE